jgi:hypothetical protein
VGLSAEQRELRYLEALQPRTPQERLTAKRVSTRAFVASWGSRFNGDALNVA